jgi:hypothetical protein
MLLQMNNSVPPLNDQSRGAAKRDWVEIVSDTSIVAIHLVVVAGIIVWVIGSSMHANLLGWIVVALPIMVGALALTVWVFRLAQKAEGSLQSDE